MYDFIKIAHIISASVLFGTGLGTAFYMFYVNSQENIGLIAKATRQVVFADWVFTGSSGIIQFLTGMWMVYLKGYSMGHVWIWGALLGYSVAGCCWIPVVYLQIKCQRLAELALVTKQPLSKAYRKAVKLWILLGIPAFISLIVVYYLMVNKIG